MVGEVGQAPEYVEIWWGLTTQKTVCCDCMLVINTFRYPETMEDGKSVGEVVVTPKTVRQTSDSVDDRLEVTLTIGGSLIITKSHNRVVNG
jgi:hypothetical protein